MSDPTSYDDEHREDFSEAVIDLKAAVLELSQAMRMLQRAVDTALGRSSNVVPLPSKPVTSSDR